VVVASIEPFPTLMFILEAAAVDPFAINTRSVYVDGIEVKVYEAVALGTV